MARIVAITGRQILDSQGRPTVEATVQLDDGAAASSSAPSGSVPTKDEAVELRDHIGSEYFGSGVSKAVNNINTEIRAKLVGMDPLYQTQVDQALVNLDGTTNKARLGANAILAVSQAVMKAAAASLRLPLFVYVKEKYQLIQAYRLPTPIFNLINGGRHGSGTLDFQEFQLVPASHLSFPQALRIGVEMFMAIDKTLEQKGAIRAMGIEGGFSPNLAANADALEIFAEAMRLTPYTLAQDAFLGLDVGPRWFFKSGKYTVKDRPQPMTGKELVKYFEELHQQFRVFAFEDPLLPDAWADWKFMTAEIGKTAMIIADDLIATNKTLLMKAIQEQACNAVVIKPNRVGTITEAIEIISLAKQAGWHTIMSHRSGETTDDILADIAVGVGTDYVKFGAPARGERVVKYNRLSRIAEILDQAQVKAPAAEMGAPATIATATGSAPVATPTADTLNTSSPATPVMSLAMAAPGAAVAAVTNREKSAAEYMQQSPEPTPTAEVLPMPAPVSANQAPSAPAGVQPTLANRLAAMSASTTVSAPEAAPVSPTPLAAATTAPVAAVPAITDTNDLQENLDALVQQIAPQPVGSVAATTATVAPTTSPAVTPVMPAPLALAQAPAAPPPTPVPTPTPTPVPAPMPNPISAATPTAVPSVALPPSVRMGTSPALNQTSTAPAYSSAAPAPVMNASSLFAAPNTQPSNQPLSALPSTPSPVFASAYPTYSPGGGNNPLPSPTLPPPVPPSTPTNPATPTITS